MWQKTTKPLIPVSPASWKLTLHHFAFMKDLHKYLFSWMKKFKEDFALMKKGICFPENCYRGSGHARQWVGHHPAPSQGTTLSISSSSHYGFELCLWPSVLHPDLFYASVSKMCPKVTASLYFSFLKDFTGVLYFLISGDPCIQLSHTTLIFFS